jgi:CBS domain-containing protein
MNRHYTAVPADTTLQRLVDVHILGSGGRSFVVKRSNEAVGLLTLHCVKEVPRSEWSTTTSAQAMIPIEHTKRVRPDADLWAALEEMDRDGVNQLPVMTDGHIQGMLSREDVITFLRTLKELGT